ncbi:MAG TPA: hypothetical protein VNF68_02285 [Candidatus Baltobacteraceae bacterium]|nr:hypothetical protein [Candidatus Baltobacteraceae bacterium]
MRKDSLRIADLYGFIPAAVAVIAPAVYHVTYRDTVSPVVAVVRSPAMKEQQLGSAIDLFA